MSRPWTPEESAAFEMMLDAGLTVKQMATLTGRSEMAINVRKSVTRPSGRFSQHYPQRNKKVQEPLPEDVMSYGRANKTANEIASIWHLVDFKRAGHKYGAGELKITPDAVCPMRMAVPLQSRTLTGSHAAMCADNAGRGY